MSYYILRAERLCFLEQEENQESDDQSGNGQRFHDRQADEHQRSDLRVGFRIATDGFQGFGSDHTLADTRTDGAQTDGEAGG